jgi:hypothetical protein
MNKLALGLAAALVSAGALPAQEAKLTAIVDVWYTQMLDNNLRLDAPYANSGARYYPLLPAFQENGFSVRRTELWLNGTITPDISYQIMFDPSATPSSGAVTGNNPTLLNDASITWKINPAFSVRVGQFKPLQTLEGSMTSTANILFYDRSMLARQFGDKRDRGIVATYSFGDPKGFGGKINVGVANGSSDYDFGKGSDRNAQKDWVARLEFNRGATQKFGLYYRDGVTDAADKGSLVAGTGLATVTPAQILDNKDRTTNLGAYYAFDNATWHGSAEAITGLLGRRNPTVFNAANAAMRQHLDQKFLGYTLSGAYKMGKHWFTARYDHLDLNAGDDWYTAASPYITAAGDFSPAYTEAILGYNYLFNAGKYALGKVKVNYIHRSQNFLQPRAGQTGEQGGDSLLVSLQIGF